MENNEGQRFAWPARIDSHGRIFIPKALREAMELHSGDELVLAFKDDSIVLRSYEDAMQQLQDAFCEGLDPKVSLIDELIEDRKKDAACETGY